jgi:hypothetical protein
MGNRYIARYAAIFFLAGAAIAAGQSQNGLNGLNGNEGDETDGRNTVPVIPIHRLWEEAGKNAVRWQPDWPLAIPPDSFEPLRSGEARLVTITVETAGDDDAGNGEGAEGSAEPGTLSPPGLAAESADDGDSPDLPVSPALYTARLNPDGSLAEFPFLQDGVFYQVSAEYGHAGVVTALTLILSPEESIEITILRTDEGWPTAARIKTGGAYYFASFLWTGKGTDKRTGKTCVEMWMDETGVPLAVFRDERVFHFDSMGNITFIGDGTRAVSARYNDKGARYWTQDGVTRSFQRDETGLVVRLTDIQEDGNETAQPPIHYTYAYTFDQNGNWTERREIRWTALNDYLVPSKGTVVKRLIDYGASLSG